MIYKEACEFFFRYGSVGRSVEDLLINTPTESQLEAACQSALNHDIDPDLVEKAKQAILKG